MALIELETETDTQEPAGQRPRWELAECTCPDPCCERDHEQD